MAVHAHPDDEASSTGGILARYGRDGVRTVVVTCTNGELGDAPDGTRPGEPGHDPVAVARHRRQELERSCQILGVSALEMLGYHDSGMAGWKDNEAGQAFWNVPTEEAAARLAELIERYRPDVVVTYDENGFYGHPDHIKANEITRAALALRTDVKKLYYPAIPRSRVAAFRSAIESAGVEMPGDDDEIPDFAVDDASVAAAIDCSDVAEAKFSALEAHSSQGDNVFFLRFGRELFAELFGTEYFTRPLDRTGTPVPEDDLFAGVG